MLPDELLYSLLGWIVTLNALKFPREYLVQVFGTKHVVPCVDLPTHLESLHVRLGSFSPTDSAEQLIEKGTIYPYHRPFLTLAHHEAVQHILLHGPGIGLKTLMGRVANRFGASPPLRYCPACIEEDIALCERPYWRRSHQLPGVTCCTKHHLNLVVHVLPSTLTDKQRFVLPPVNLSPSMKRVASGTQQLRFAELSQSLLEAGLLAQDPMRRSTTYTWRISDLGFLTRSNHIDYNALAAAVRRHYDDFRGFPHRDRLLSTPVHPLGWLRTLVDRPSRSSHPICHLLLIGYLFGTIDAFKKAVQHIVRSDVKSLDGMDEIIVTSSSEDTAAQQDRLLHDVSLSCREVAKALNLSVTTVVCKRRTLGVPIAERRKYLDRHRLEAIAKALANGKSSQSIASRQRVSLSTVYRLRTQSPALVKMHIDHEHNRELSKRRKRWELATYKYGDRGITFVRTSAPATYTWLYRHDRTWLQQFHLKPRSKSERNPRVNWAKRDRELCQYLQRHVASIMSWPNRPRISKTLMFRYLGDAMIRANLERLPRLQKSLENLEESLQAFHFFRIDRAIEQLATRNLPMTLWRIQRLAGIREFTESLRDYANRRAGHIG
jgi:transposase